MRGALIVLVFCLFLSLKSYSQSCTTLGQNPSTAFPVCGTTTFVQTNVPICGSTNMIVPGCNDGAQYQDKNPFWYKFTCYQAGTLGFTITPNDLGDDYDWQLFDITGHDPNDVYTDASLFVIANWAGTFGLTGASSTGTSNVQCASVPSDGRPTFSIMPTLIVGHTYILLVSHYTDSQSGYSLSFGGGTAVITDPILPTVLSAKPDCDGKKITVRLNKRVKCSSLTLSGSEFSISNGGPAVIAATPDSCSFAFDFQELVLTLAAPLTNGNYDVIVNNGSDGTTLLDNCDHSIAQNLQIPFFYNIPQPIFADSIGKVNCAPQEVKVYFPKKIDCSTIAADGSDFSVTGPTPISVSSATGNCVNGKTDFIIVKFTTPVYTKGLYTLTLKAGTDGSTVIDECGIQLPVHSRNFTAVDTVSADFTYTSQLDCRFNSLSFTHNGANDVNKWHWTFNSTINSNNPNHTIVFPASSTNTVQLAVTNGVCSDTVTRTIVMDNEVKVGFEMPPVLCPEDPLVLTNTSTGLIDSWQWNFGTAINNLSGLKTPQPYLFPNDNTERYYTIKLKAVNNALNCTDSISKKIRVLNNCFIAVPTAFTPNGDGLNDYLFPNNALKADNLEFRVFNRWGQLVFETRDWTKKWDGKIKGIPQAPDVFVWFLSYTHIVTGEKVFQKGTTTLIR